MILQKYKRAILILWAALAAFCLPAFAGCAAAEPPQPEPTTYTVTFMADGKLVATVPYTDGDAAVPEPEVPEKTGYTGVWEHYTLTACNLTVNAVYTLIVRYTVSFDTNGGDLIPAQTVAAGESLELPAPQKNGYLFLGWCVSPELSDAHPLNSGERYTPGETGTLYAKWRALNFYEFIFDSSTGTIRGLTDDSHPIGLVIPARIDGYDVKKITDNAFKNCKTLTSVEIPDSVEWIGAFAFSGCSALERVTIGSGVANIGTSAFEGCGQLTGVYISDLAAWCSISFGHTFSSPWTSNPLHYAQKLYLNDSLLTDLVIPQGVTSVGRIAFKDCTSLTSVTLSDSVVSIGSSAFRNCSLLSSVVISNSVTSIGSNAFANCGSLLSVTIPESVTSIEAFVFDGCARLTDIWCEAKRKPSGWSADWFKYSRPTVHWGDTWEYIDGVPTEKR